MAFKLLTPRTREVTFTTGTGDIALASSADTIGLGADPLYVGPIGTDHHFSDALADGDTTFARVISTDDAWEEGLYTYNATPNSLSRTGILASSNSGSAINLAGGRVAAIIPSDFSALFDQLFGSTSGTVPQRGASSWSGAAIGGGGGSGGASGALVATIDATGIADLQWTGLDATKYYRLIVYDVLGGANTVLQFGTGSTAWQTSSYRYAARFNGSGGFNTTFNSESASGIFFTSGSSVGGSGVFDILNQQITGQQNQPSSDTHDYNISTSGRYTGSGPVTALRIHSTSAFTSGKASLYKTDP